MGTAGPWFDRPADWPVLSRSAGFSARPKAGIISALPREKIFPRIPRECGSMGLRTGVAPGRFHDPACGNGGMLLAAGADLAAIEKQDFSLSIPLCVACTPAAGAAAREGSEADRGIRSPSPASWKTAWSNHSIRPSASRSTPA